MQAYGISYSIRGKKDSHYDTIVEAKDVKSAKRKLGKKHGYKDGRMINIYSVTTLGYF